MARRTCPQCGAKYASKRARMTEILGAGFFEVLELRDLGHSQRTDVEHRSRFCSDECASAGQVRESLAETAKMKVKLVRPHRYTYKGHRFEKGLWYEVPFEVAKRLNERSKAGTGPVLFEFETVDPQPRTRR